MEEPPIDRIGLSLTSEVLLLDVVQGLCNDIGQRAGLDDEQSFDVALALREGVNNAILHGNQRDRLKRVEVDFLIYADRLEIAIRDQGPGFTTSDLPDPLAPNNLMKTSGRGVFLIRHYMDDVKLDRASERGEIRMIKRLPKSDN